MRLRVRHGATILAMTLAIAPGSTSAQATDSRLSPFRILVPDLQPIEGADRGFGRDVAEELRDLLGTLETHSAIDRDDIRDALDEVDIDMEDVDCTIARQLADRVDARVVLCASYTEPSNDRFRIEATFYDVASGDAFQVDPTSGTRRGSVVAAGHIFQQFDGYVRFLRAAANCESYAQSRLWQDALRNCDEALGLNASATSTRYRRARILFDSERLEDSLEETERVLDADPVHEAALQLAGYVSASLGRASEALDYYTRYLQLNPDNTRVRMRVAYDLARAGDVRSALLLIQEGLDEDPEDAELLAQLAVYALSAADGMVRDAGNAEDAGLSPEIEQLYRTAADAFEQVIELRGEEVDVAHVRGAIRAYLRLDEPFSATQIGMVGVEWHPDDARLWSVYADAIRRTGRLDQALDALAEVRRLEPDYPRLGLRTGSWMLEATRVDDAIEVLRDVALTEPDEAGAAARLVLSHAHGQGIEARRYQDAIEMLGQAKGFSNLGVGVIRELNFWMGYASYMRAIEIQGDEPTVESARGALPVFETAARLLEDVGDYPTSVGVNIEQLRQSVQQYIEIQRAVIRRGGGPG